MNYLVLSLLFFLSAASFADYDYEACRKKSVKRDSSIPFDRQGNFIPECAPDTLFTWQSRKDIYRWAENSTPENVLPIDEETWFWRTPAGTFAYGDMSIRVKLNEDVRFAKIDSRGRDCAEYSDEEKENTVFVAYLSHLRASEYILCDSSAVHSWSYGTQRHLDEINLDVWIIDCFRADPEKVDLYMQRPHGTTILNNGVEVEAPVRGRFGFSVDAIFPLNLLGFASSWSDRTLLEHIANIEEIVERSEGNIYYSQKAIDNGDENHFETNAGQYYAR